MTADSDGSLSRADRVNLSEYVRTDPELSPSERETSFQMVDADDRLSVYTENAGLMNRLLHHPAFDLKSIRVWDEDKHRFGARVNPEDHSGEGITGIDGYLPIGALSVSSSPRSTDKKSRIVSGRVLEYTPEESG